NDSIKRTYSTEGISPTLTTMGGGHREPKIAEQQEPTIDVVGNVKPKGSTRHGQRDMVYGDNGLMGALNASDYKQPRPIAQEVRPIHTPDRMEKCQNGRRFKDNDEDMFTITSQDRHGIAEEQGLPIREATKKGYAIAQEGDSVNVQFPNSKTRRGRVGKQIANTLEASSINQGVVTPKYRIRKLTPLECWRLQGFPDEAHEAVKQAGISDSQRYKQAGN